MTKPTIFICYSHTDIDMKERLLTHLSAVFPHETVEVFADSTISPGEIWNDQIEHALDTAIIAVLLVSETFLRSEFINDVEIPRLLERQKSEDLRLVPVILTQCEWKKAEWLQRIQALPDDGIPLLDRKSVEIEKELKKIAYAIKDWLPPNETIAPARLIGALAITLILAAFSAGHYSVATVETLVLDWFFKLRGQKVAPSQVVLVTRGEASASDLDLSLNSVEPWPRSLHTNLVKTLSQQGASVIAFDMHFEASHPTDDREFASAIRAATKVVVVERAYTDETSEEVKVAPTTPQIGQVTAGAPFPLPTSKDGPIPPLRESWLYVQDFGGNGSECEPLEPAAMQRVPTLPLVAFQLHALPIYGDFLKLLAKAHVAPAAIKQLPQSETEVGATSGVRCLIQRLRQLFLHDPTLAETLIQKLSEPEWSGDPKRNRRLLSMIRAYKHDDSVFINFYGKRNEMFTTVRYSCVIGRCQASPPRIDFSDATVFVGYSKEKGSEVRRDEHLSPFSTINGVEVAATMFANLLESSVLVPISPTSRGIAVCLLAVLGFSLGVAYAKLPGLRMAILVAALGTGGAYFVIAYEYFVFEHVLVPVIIPVTNFAFLVFIGGSIFKQRSI